MLSEMHEYHIGTTPLIRIPDINGNQIYIKSEGDNYFGSIKARTGYYLIKLLPSEAIGKTIIESTSGNLGFALGFFCKEAGMNFVALIDPSIANSKQQRLKNANIQYQKVNAFPGMDYRSSRIIMAQKMTESGRYFWINQYHNKAGVQAHECTTAPEIYEQTNHRVTHIVCAMGSCGTICGLGRFFRKHNPDVKIIGTEPYGSTIFGTVHCNYLNVGAGLVGKPGNLLDNPDTVDEAYAVHDEDSIRSAQMLWNLYHFNAGITTGMSYYIAQKIASKINEGCIVVISPDGRESYSEYLR